MKIKIWFCLLIVPIVLLPIGGLAGPISPILVENGHCEGRMYLKDGEIYTDRIVVKFKDLVLDLPRGQRIAPQADLGRQYSNLKSVLNQLDNAYGIKEVIK